MSLSLQGNAVLFRMFESFQTHYLENNPGVNMNDVERDFLYIILHHLVHNADTFPVYSQELKDMEAMIEKIR